jgi:catechol 2,3-dioxygenase-like lactoylglutathione lyase family enzyme
MVRVSYAIVFVSDMARSVAFYRETLGLPLGFQSTHWTEFATEGATLALHRAEPPSGGAGAVDPAAGHCRPGLSVPDLNAFHARMIEIGVPCLQPPKEVFGALIAQYQDPDGLTISVGETK